MTMRMLHVVGSLAPEGTDRTFLDVLQHVRAEDGSVAHDVVTPTDVDLATLDQYDVVHILSERCAYRVLPELIARSTIPIVYGKNDDLHKGLHWQADESMLAVADGATFTSADLAGAYEPPAGRTTILGVAADLDRFHAIPAPPPSTPQRIVCVEALHPRRCLDDLLQALARVSTDVPGAELRLVRGEDVVAELEDARIVALPSWGEGVPAALLQGMAAGRPVVAAAADHIAAIVDQGVEGFLVVPGDVESLADRLTRLLLDRQLAAAMGQAARIRSAGHDVRVVARRLLRALRAAA